METSARRFWSHLGSCARRWDAQNCEGLVHDLPAIPATEIFRMEDTSYDRHGSSLSYMCRECCAKSANYETREFPKAPLDERVETREKVFRIGTVTCAVRRRPNGGQDH